MQLRFHYSFGWQVNIPASTVAHIVLTTFTLPVRSAYGYVEHFFKVSSLVDRCYASVHWLSQPTYPCNGNVLVVRCTKNADPEFTNKHGTVIDINRIDPTPVLIEPDGEYFFMMRINGYDSAAT